MIHLAECWDQWQDFVSMVMTSGVHHCDLACQEELWLVELVTCDFHIPIFVPDIKCEVFSCP